MQPYHKYVFDNEKSQFVGQFEEMYKAEDSEGFDSWFERDLRQLRKTISLTILDDYNFSAILDVGCGKGAFAHLLKRQNNRVVGIDASATAVRKAKESFPEIDFRCMDARDLSSLNEKFDLVIVMDIFAYIDGWPDVVETISSMTHWVYISEYIPPSPIGFVKSSEQLIAGVERYFDIKTKVIMDDEHCMLLGEVRKEGP